MWQVYLYLANEHQVRQRETRARHRGRRWSFGRRAQPTRSTTGPERRSATTPDRAH